VFVNKSISSYQERIFHTIKDEWFLITVKDGEKVNMMTAAWGSVGIMWNKPIFNIVVRNTRHTYNLLENASSFTCSFFSSVYKDELTYCGRYSGKDVDKVKETGLIPIEIEPNLCTFEQAHTVFCCNIASVTPILSEHFIDPSIEKHYSNNDYHTMYTGYITRLMVKEKEV